MQILDMATSRKLAENFKDILFYRPICKTLVRNLQKGL